MVVFRTVLTAAHCICRYADFEVDGKRANRHCLLNKSPDQLQNQQTERKAAKLNHLYLRVCDKDDRKSLEVEVEKAYVMKMAIDKSHPPGNHVVLKSLFDIGLIFPVASIKILVHKCHLAPLKLPPR